MLFFVVFPHESDKLKLFLNVFISENRTGENRTSEEDKCTVISLIRSVLCAKIVGKNQASKQKDLH